MSKPLGGTPVVLLIAIAVLMALLQPNEPQIVEPTLLMPVLDVLLVLATSLAVAYISMKGYLASGPVALLLLGSAVLVHGSANVMAFFLKNLTAGAGVSLTVRDGSAVFGAVIHIVNVFVAVAEATTGTEPRRRRLNVTLFYVCFLLFAVILVVAILLGVVPALYTGGYDVTAFGYDLIRTTVVLFALSSIAFMVLYLKSKTSMFYWYSLALALLGVSSFASLYAKGVGGVLDWTLRLTQYLGGIYFLVVVHSALRPKPSSVATAETLKPPAIREEVELPPIESGHAYVVENDLERAFKIFSDSIKEGREGLIITREHPANLRKKRDLQKTEIVWLTSEKDETKKTANSLQDISLLITEHIERAKQGAILLDGIEFLITNSGFEPTLHFVQSKRNQMETTGGILVIPVSTEALQLQQIRMIEREAVPVK